MKDFWCAGFNLLKGGLLSLPASTCGRALHACRNFVQAKASTPKISHIIHSLLEPADKGTIKEENTNDIVFSLKYILLVIIVLLVFLPVLPGCTHEQSSFNSDQIQEKRDTKETDLNKLLQSAVVAGNFEETESLLSDGADVNTSNSDGQTVLMIAVESRRFAIIELLIATGASKDTADLEGKTVFDYISEDEEGELIEDIINEEAFDISQLNEILVETAIKRRRNAQLVEWVLSKGADPNAMVPEGRRGLTPLIALCSQRTNEVNKLVEITRVLLSHPDIDIHIKIRGRTALDLAKRNRYTEIVELLENYSN